MMQESVLELGRKLVSQLNLDPGVDTLSRWMSHYIAELINHIESSTGVEKKKAEKECAELIMRLWKHRYELPEAARPLGNLEEILRTLKLLDPSANPFPPYDIRKEKKDHVIPVNGEEWLELARELESTYRVLVNYCLRQAMDDVDRDARDWIELASRAGFDVERERIVISFFGEKTGHHAALIDGTINDNADKLERLSLVASRIAQHLRLDRSGMDNEAN